MKLYVVKNYRGEYLRSAGTGRMWSADLSKAKFYPKIGTAKARCTYWYSMDQSVGCPVILEFDLDDSKANVITVVDEITKSIQKRKERLENIRKHREMVLAVRNMDKVQEFVKTLTPEQKARLKMVI